VCFEIKGLGFFGFSFGFSLSLMPLCCRNTLGLGFEIQGLGFFLCAPHECNTLGLGFEIKDLDLGVCPMLLCDLGFRLSD